MVLQPNRDGQALRHHTADRSAANPGNNACRIGTLRSQPCSRRHRRGAYPRGDAGAESAHGNLVPTKPVFCTNEVPYRLAGNGTSSSGRRRNRNRLQACQPRGSPREH